MISSSQGLLSFVPGFASAHDRDRQLRVRRYWLLQFGENDIYYGRCRSGVATDTARSRQFDASKDIRCDGTTIQVPFGFTELVENLRRERYRQKIVPVTGIFAESEAVHKLLLLHTRVSSGFGPSPVAKDLLSRLEEAAVPSLARRLHRGHSSRRSSCDCRWKLVASRRCRSFGFGQMVRPIAL